MIGEQMIDAPESQTAETGCEQVRVNVDDLRGSEYVRDHGFQVDRLNH